MTNEKVNPYAAGTEAPNEIVQPRGDHWSSHPNRVPTAICFVLLSLCILAFAAILFYNQSVFVAHDAVFGAAVSLGFSISTLIVGAGLFLRSGLTIKLGFLALLSVSMIFIVSQATSFI